jgi:hypothetical protein
MTERRRQGMGSMSWHQKFTVVKEKISLLHLSIRGIGTNTGERSERRTCEAL